MSAEPTILPFKISVLVFLRDTRERFLLIRRRKAPNLNCWSPIGGKLEMAEGESPFECAARETGEETGLAITARDLHLFGMISERGYEGTGHWLMFLFNCHKRMERLPEEIDEGAFGWFAREEIDGLALPPTDRTLVWPVYDKYHDSFIAYRAECDPSARLRMTIEESHLEPNRPSAA